jgi:hypothetical protein
VQFRKLGSWYRGRRTVLGIIALEAKVVVAALPLVTLGDLIRRRS